MLKKEDSHLDGLRGRRHLADQSARRSRADWTACVASSTSEEEDQMARSSA